MKTTSCGGIWECFFVDKMWIKCEYRSKGMKILFDLLLIGGEVGLFL